MKLEEAVKQFESRFRTAMDGFSSAISETNEAYVSIESGPPREQGETMVCWFTTEEAAVGAWLRNANEYAKRQNAKVLRWRRRPGVEAGPPLISLDFGREATTPVLVPTFAVRSRMLASDKPAVFGIDPTHPDGVRDFVSDGGEWAPPEMLTGSRINASVSNHDKPESIGSPAPGQDAYAVGTGDPSFWRNCPNCGRELIRQTAPSASPAKTGYRG